ncbi:hypothetical protein [Methylocystis rosea]|jgi:hypothetical protein|uniref:DUF3024 domain-containing protein n=2 Tax=Methylocystis TaxID=133 RepID=UPI00037A672D
MASMRSTVTTLGGAASAQPNEFDYKRIVRALEQRRRYRYVTPVVTKTANGYRIQSPCCSRNVDPDGGVIDIALVLFDERKGNWRLLRKDHAIGVWELDSEFSRLAELLDHLKEDAERRFWQ